MLVAVASLSSFGAKMVSPLSTIGISSEPGASIVSSYKLSFVSDGDGAKYTREPGNSFDSEPLLLLLGLLLEEPLVDDSARKPGILYLGELVITVLSL